MADSNRINVGGAEFDITPIAKGIDEKLKAQIEPAAAKAGDAAGKTFGDEFVKTSSERSSKTKVGPSKSQTSRDGSDAGGAFADAFAARLKAASRNLPKLTIDADSSDADKAIAEIKAELDALANKKVGIDIDESTALADLDLLQARLTQIANEHPSIAVQMNTTAASAEIDRFRAQLDALAHDEPVITPDVNTDKASANIGAFATDMRTRLTAAVTNLPDIEIKADSSDADLAIAAIREDLASLSEKTIGVDIDEGDAIAQLDILRARLQALADTSPSIQVRADVASAIADMDIVLAKVDEIGARSPTINVNADTAGADANLVATGLLATGLGGLRESINVEADTGSAVASMAAATASAVTLKGAMIGLGLISLAPMAVGLLAVVGPLAAVAAGFAGMAAVAIPAASNIKKAIDAQGKATADAATAAATLKTANTAVASAQASLADAERNAAQQSVTAAEQVQKARQALADAIAQQTADQKSGAQSIADAEQTAAAQRVTALQSVASAQQAAAQSEQTALGQVHTAEESLASAQLVARNAQLSLTDARKAAADQLKQLSFQTADAALSQRGGQLAVESAKQNLDAVNANKKSTQLQRAEAKLAFDEAVQQLKEQTDQTKTLAAQKADADKKGIKGSDQVLQAQQNIAKANQDVKDQQTALADAQKNAVQVQLDGQAKIAAAQKNVVDVEKAGAKAIAAAQKTAADQQVTDARRITDAQQGIGDALRTQANQAADSASSIQRAQVGLSTAADAQRKAQDGATTAAGKAKAALDKLTPSEVKAMNAFDGFKTAFKGWAADLEPAVLPAFTGALGLLQGALDPLKPAIVGVATGIDTLEGKAAKAFQGPFWTNFSKFIGDESRTSTVKLGIALGGIGTGLAGTFQGLAPLGDIVLSGLDDITTDFSNFGKSLATNGPGEQIMSDFTTLKPKMVKLFENTGGLLSSVFSAAIHVSPPVIDFISGVEKNLSPLAKTLGNVLRPALDKISGPAGKFFALFTQAVVQWLKDTAPDWKSLATSFGNLLTHVGPLLKPLGQVLALFTHPAALILEAFAQALSDVADVAVKHPTAFKIVAGGILAIAISLGILNAALSIGPLGELVVALGLITIGLVELKKHQGDITSFETKANTDIGNFVKGIPGALGRANIWLHNSGAMWMASLWGGIQSGYTIINNFFDGLGAHIQGWFVHGGKWLYAAGVSILAGLWAGSLAQWASVSAWFGGFRLRFASYFVKATTWLVDGGKWVMGGLWSGIRIGYTATNNFFDAIGGYIIAFFKKSPGWLLTAGKWILGGLWSGIKWVWVNTVENGFFLHINGKIAGFFAGAGKWLYQAGVSIMTGLGNGIKDAFETVKGWFSGAISWIIDNVINKFLGLIEKIPGVPDNLTISNPFKKAPPKKDGGGEGGGGGQIRRPTFAAGGVLPGFTPGRDVHHFTSPTAGMLSFSGGEAVMRPEFTQKVGGLAGVNALNKWAMGSGAPGRNPDGHFLFGGIIKNFQDFGNWAGSKAAQIGNGAVNRTSQDLRDPNPLHIARRAYDASVDLAASAARAAANNAPGGAIVADIGKGIIDQLSNVLKHDGHKDINDNLAVSGGDGGKFLSFAKKFTGQPYVWGGSDPGGFDCSGLTSYVMNHFGLHSPRTASQQEAWVQPLSAAAALPGDLIFYGGSIGHGGAHHVAFNEGGGKMFEAQQTGVPLGSYTIRGGGLYGRAPGATPFLGGGTGVGSIGTIGTITGGGSAAANRDLGRDIANSMGLGSQFAAIDYVASHESGWNNFAQNPTSTAYGIGQFLNSTFAEYGGKTSDPARQIRDMLAYMVDRYGSPVGAENYWKAHHSYDNGGYLQPGFTTVYNGTGKPEPVLKPDELAQLRSGSGRFSGTLVLSSGEFLGVVDGRIDSALDTVATQVTHGRQLT